MASRDHDADASLGHKATNESDQVSLSRLDVIEQRCHLPETRLWKFAEVLSTGGMSLLGHRKAVTLSLGETQDLVAVARAAEHLSPNRVPRSGDDPFKAHKALYALQDALAPLLAEETL